VPGEISGQGFHVVPDALRSHAGSVDKAADAVSQAADAGEQVRLGGAAYGLLLRMFPPTVDSIQSEIVQVGKDAVTALQSAADLLRDMALRYENSDTSADQSFSKLADRMSQ
jgi:uncharacterized protein YukE